MTRRPARTTARPLTTKQTGQRLGVSDWTVRELIHTGKLTASNIASRPGSPPRWRIGEDDIADYLDATTYRPPARRLRTVGGAR